MEWGGNNLGNYKNFTIFIFIYGIPNLLLAYVYWAVIWNGRNLEWIYSAVIITYCVSWLIQISKGRLRYDDKTKKKCFREDGEMTFAALQKDEENYIVPS